MTRPHLRRIRCTTIRSCPSTVAGSRSARRAPSRAFASAPREQVSEGRRSIALAGEFLEEATFRFDELGRPTLAARRLHAEIIDDEPNDFFDGDPARRQMELVEIENITIGLNRRALLHVMPAVMLLASIVFPPNQGMVGRCCNSLKAIPVALGRESEGSPSLWLRTQDLSESEVQRAMATRPQRNRHLFVALVEAKRHDARIVGRGDRVQLVAARKRAADELAQVSDERVEALLRSAAMNGHGRSLSSAPGTCRASAKQCAQHRELCLGDCACELPPIEPSERFPSVAGSEHPPCGGVCTLLELTSGQHVIQGAIPRSGLFRGTLPRVHALERSHVSTSVHPHERKNGHDLRESPAVETRR